MVLNEPVPSPNKRRGKSRIDMSKNRASTPIACRQFSHGDTPYSLARDGNKITIINRSNNGYSTKEFASIAAAKSKMNNPHTLF